MSVFRPSCVRVVLIAALVPAFGVGCDSGGKGYKRGAEEEESGRYLSAAEAYESVCRDFPKDDPCRAARPRAGQMRLKLSLIHI